MYVELRAPLACVHAGAGVRACGFCYFISITFCYWSGMTVPVAGATQSAFLSWKIMQICSPSPEWHASVRGGESAVP